MPAVTAGAAFAPLVEASWAFALIALLSICSGYLVDMFRAALRTRDAVVRLFDSYESIKLTAAKLVFKLSVLPYEGWIALSAAAVSLWRTLVSHKNMLQWVTAAQADRTAQRSVAGYYRAMLAAPVAGTILAVLGILTGAPGFRWSFRFCGGRGRMPPRSFPGPPRARSSKRRTGRI